MNYESGCSVLKQSQSEVFKDLDLCLFTYAYPNMDACVGNSKKSRITITKNHIFYDLAEFAPPNNPFDNFDNSNPTTPRIGTNVLRSNTVAAEFPRPGI